MNKEASPARHEEGTPHASSFNKQGANSIGEKILVKILTKILMKILSKSYNKKFDKSVVYIGLLFKLEFR